ncbi:MAG: hypothetical protein U5L10_04145 [Candidatus Moranbacteria bacterium]|nr:hypothetical protein [Candidatus Moranbacteria bacterium]
MPKRNGNKRKAEKRSDPVTLRQIIKEVKAEIDCLSRKGDCQERLQYLQKRTLPKLEKRLTNMV